MVAAIAKTSGNCSFFNYLTSELSHIQVFFPAAATSLKGGTVVRKES